MTTLKVTMIDDRPAVFLPANLDVTEGTELLLDEGVLRPVDTSHEDQLSAMKDVMVRRREVLKRLAE